MSNFIKEIKKGKNQKYLFKFSNVRLSKLKSILQSQIYLSDVRSFNDPLELHFLPIGNPIRFSFKLILSEFQHKRIPKLREIVKFIKQKNSDLQFLNQEVNRIADVYAVTCFAKNIGNPLLWSHYAESHKGICLIFGFDLGEGEGGLVGIPDQKKETISLFVEDVIYQRKFPTFLPNQERKNRRILFTKGVDWKYEEEVRIVSKRKPGLVEIPKNALKGICFGISFSEDKIGRFKKLLGSRYHNLEYFKMVKKSGRFGLGMVRI
ncbi:DUF2971 domain-containing protein [Leptospira meyeri]|uniref:DUF2971 domain-containing protein n=1 Tax=Leptospira meyeri TaxID=29508 RepID=UPI0002BDCDDB|nr:DUF2971 domain-containing protein [Leptospira meyeri]EMJ90069.1 PF11185 family protein [Leptospira meyeri serovar Semaranga str. Veldrot Semarang 173]